MTDNHLHIVTHEVPWPVNYGGVVDLFYKIKTLHQLGVNIHLHCFTQERGPQEELNKYCSSVKYYPRKKNISRLSFNLPFIVNSRVSEELLAALQKDNYPVLLEGIHSTHPLFKGQLNNRTVLVRLHNAEFEYYRQIAKQEHNFLKRSYFAHESRLLKKYEQAIANKALFCAVSKQDVEIYQQQFQAKQIQYLPVFLPYTLAVGKEGKGCFALYHGNLSVNENEKAAIWLLEKVFDKTTIPFVIAGKDPSKKLQRLAHAHPHTCLVANPGDNEMQDLIAKAHVHILPSFNNTGVKLKLLNALFNGRHCLVNPAAVAGSDLEAYCHIANDAATFQQKVNELFALDFTEDEIQKRQGLLQRQYNNEENGRKLIALLN